MRLNGAPSTFQNIMDKILTVLQGIDLFFYMNDIVVYVKSLTKHQEKMKRLETAGLRYILVNAYSSRRWLPRTHHLLDPKKTEAVSMIRRPKNCMNIEHFLGLAGYYRRFIPAFANIAKPLTYLMKSEVPFVWDRPQKYAFLSPNLVQKANFSIPGLQSNLYPHYGFVRFRHMSHTHQLRHNRPGFTDCICFEISRRR